MKWSAISLAIAVATSPSAGAVPANPGPPAQTPPGETPPDLSDPYDPPVQCNFPLTPPRFPTTPPTDPDPVNPIDSPSSPSSPISNNGSSSKYKSGKSSSGNGSPAGPDGVPGAPGASASSSKYKSGKSSSGGGSKYKSGKSRRRGLAVWAGPGQQPPASGNPSAPADPNPVPGASASSSSSKYKSGKSSSSSSNNGPDGAPGAPGGSSSSSKYKSGKSSSSSSNNNGPDGAPGAPGGSSSSSKYKSGKSSSSSSNNNGPDGAPGTPGASASSSSSKYKNGKSSSSSSNNNGPDGAPGAPGGSSSSSSKYKSGKSSKSSSGSSNGGSPGGPDGTPGTPGGSSPSSKSGNSGTGGSPEEPTTPDPGTNPNPSPSACDACVGSYAALVSAFDSQVAELVTSPNAGIAIGICPGATISFDTVEKGIAFNRADSGLTTEIDMVCCGDAADCVFDGAGPAVERGSPLMDFSSPVHLTIDGITVSNVYGMDNTADVLKVSNGVVELYNFSVIDSKNLGNGGNLIFVKTGQVYMENVSVTGNTSTGAIYQQFYGTMTMYESTFSNNKSNIGAVYGDEVNFELFKSVFDGNALNANTKRLNSGAAVTVASGGTLYVESVTFNLNEGGAIYTDQVHVVVLYSTFTGNTSRGSGAAVCSQNGSVLLEANTITGNAAQQFGGGVYGKDVTLQATCNLIDGNTAAFTGTGNVSSSGGGTYVENGHFVSQGNSYTGNTAESGGGGVNVKKATVFMIEDQLDGNTASVGNDVRVNFCTTLRTCDLVSEIELAAEKGAVYLPDSCDDLLSMSSYN